VKEGGQGPPHPTVSLNDALRLAEVGTVALVAAILLAYKLRIM